MTDRNDETKQNSQRFPLFNLEAEEAVLGTIIQHNEVMQNVNAAGIIANDFYLDKNRRLFAVMCSMYEAKEEISGVSLADRLKEYDILDNVGGCDYIARLIKASVTESQIEDCIAAIITTSDFRTNQQLSSSIKSLASKRERKRIAE